MLSRKWRKDSLLRKRTPAGGELAPCVHMPLPWETLPAEECIHSATQCLRNGNVTVT